MTTAVRYRQASALDVPVMLRSRDADSPGDERMAAYLEGRHHPHQALPARIVWMATTDDGVIGYVGGHRTRRFNCDGELQYLYVSPAFRRSGVGRTLVEHLARWFVDQDARRVCVNVNSESPAARPFYRSLGAEELQPHWMVWPDIAVVFARPLHPDAEEHASNRLT